MFDLCDKMNYASLKLNLIDVENCCTEIKNGINEEFLPYFLEENELIVGKMMMIEEIEDDDCLYFMMDEFVNMIGNPHRKLCKLFTIYDTILYKYR